MASGDEDHNLLIWNTRSGKIVRQYRLPHKIIDNIEWCPTMDQCLLAVANETEVHLICPELFRKDINHITRDIFLRAEQTYKIESVANEKKEQFCKWIFKGTAREEEVHPHILASIVFKIIISRLAWHSKADYLSTMAHNI